jgi:hypothetical protein
MLPGHANARDKSETLTRLSHPASIQLLDAADTLRLAINRGDGVEMEASLKKLTDLMIFINPMG